MKCQNILVILSLFWSHVVSQTCRTPAGETSVCISIFECKPLYEALNKRPITKEVVTYLQRSSCGFVKNTPNVCCGPVPHRNSTSTSTPTTSKPVGNTDPVFVEDSLPASVKECGRDEGGDRIYGGQFTDLGEFSWMALLGYFTADSSLAYECGGVLINKRYVLTAAHCVVGEIEWMVGKLFTVRLGEYDTNTDKDCIEDDCAEPHQEIRVWSAHPHPWFVDGSINREDDIALVRLAQRANYSDFVNPICMPEIPRILPPDTELYVAGWGSTLTDKRSPVKLKLAVRVYDIARCYKKYRSLGVTLIGNQLCAGGVYAEDSCRGDSGGPLMWSRPNGVWEAVGVVSFSYGCGREDWPTVYTRTSLYKHWILNTMRSTNI